MTIKPERGLVRSLPPEHGEREHPDIVEWVAVELPSAAMHKNLVARVVGRGDGHGTAHHAGFWEAVRVAIGGRGVSSGGLGVPGPGCNIVDVDFCHGGLVLVTHLAHWAGEETRGG